MPAPYKFPENHEKFQFKIVVSGCRLHAYWLRGCVEWFIACVYAITFQVLIQVCKALQRFAKTGKAVLVYSVSAHRGSSRNPQNVYGKVPSQRYSGSSDVCFFCRGTHFSSVSTVTRPEQHTNSFWEAVWWLKSSYKSPKRSRIIYLV